MPEQPSKRLKLPDEITAALSIVAISISLLALIQQMRSDETSKQLNRPIMSIDTKYATASVATEKLTRWEGSLNIPLRNVGHATAKVEGFNNVFSNIVKPTGVDTSSCALLNPNFQSLNYKDVYPEVSKEIMFHFKIDTRCALPEVQYSVQFAVNYSDTTTGKIVVQDPIYFEFIFKPQR